MVGIWCPETCENGFNDFIAYSIRQIGSAKILKLQFLVDK